MNPDSTAVLKICLLGEFGVGKSSLANRLVLDDFSEVYRSTIGVRTLACTAVWRNGTRQRCVVWDVVGEPTLSDLTRRYLVGAQVVLFLADGLRKRTLKAALTMADEAGVLYPTTMRRVLVLTKLDQRADWQVSLEDIDAAAGHGIAMALTSSRDALGFDALSEVLGFTIEAADGAQ